jgi:acetyl esterase/lipase
MKMHVVHAMALLQRLAIGSLSLLLSGCSYVGAFVRADDPRTLFERGYFAEMGAELGYPPARSLTAVQVHKDLTYGAPGAGNDSRAHLLDVFRKRDAAGSGDSLPVLVWVHGGGLNAGDKDDETRVNTNMAVAFAEQDFVVLNVNHRLARDEAHPAQAQDLAAAVAWAVRHAAEFGGDPHRLVLAGFSSGGYLAALVAGDPRYLADAGVDRRRVRAVFAVSGFYDLQHLAQPFLVRKFIVEPAFGARSEQWDVASPVRYVGAHWPPSLLMTAESDRASNPQSADLCERLRQFDVPCEHWTLPGRSHATAVAALGDGTADVSWGRVVAWLHASTGSAGLCSKAAFQQAGAHFCCSR